MKAANPGDGSNKAMEITVSMEQASRKFPNDCSSIRSCLLATYMYVRNSTNRRRYFWRDPSLDSSSSSSFRKSNFRINSAAFLSLSEADDLTFGPSSITLSPDRCQVPAGGRSSPVVISTSCSIAAADAEGGGVLNV